MGLAVVKHFLAIAFRLHLQSTHAIMPSMNAKNRKTLTAIFSDPANGNMVWNKIEAFFTAIGCRSVEGAGSSVTFERNGIRACFHRPHPARAALRYRIKAAREFLTKLGETP